LCDAYVARAGADSKVLRVMTIYDGGGPAPLGDGPETARPIKRSTTSLMPNSKRIGWAVADAAHVDAARERSPRVIRSAAR
jgi:hypothetical protein